MFGRTRTRVAVLATAIALVGGVTTVALADSSSPPSNSVSAGRGIDEFGITEAYYQHQTLPFTYTKGFFCDTSVTSSASSGCEVGQTYNRPPAPQFDPLYITVPLGFSVPMQQCPTALVCVDHPGTVDLTRLESALKPLYPQLTDAQLTDALKNFAVPGHDHFITDTNQFLPEWWDVQVVGVTSPQVYADIQHQRSSAKTGPEIARLAGRRVETSGLRTNMGISAEWTVNGLTSAMLRASEPAR